MFSFEGANLQIVGVDGGEGTPVPIPNTEVKLTCADNTWLATAREDKKMPTQNKTPSEISEGVFVFLKSISILRHTAILYGNIKRVVETPTTYRIYS